MLRLSDLNKTKVETFHSNVLFLLVKRAATTSRKIQCMPWRPIKKKNVHLRRSSSNFIHEKQGSLGTINLTNSRKFATPREMRSEEWAQKSLLMSRALPKYGKCYWLVKANCLRHTTQNWECDVAVKPVVAMSRNFGCFPQARLPWPNLGCSST